jgi:APA family basic amino acid/polyamine antiporter
MMFPFGMSAIAEATALFFFEFTGFACISTLAQEVKNQKKTIPRTINITISFSIVLYVLVSLVAIGILRLMAMTNNKCLQVAANALNTSGIKIIITFGASFALLGVLGISRRMFAMRRRNDL